MAVSDGQRQHGPHVVVDHLEVLVQDGVADVSSRNPVAVGTVGADPVEPDGERAVPGTEMHSWHPVAVQRSQVEIAAEQDQILECVGVREDVRLDLEEHLRQAVNDVGRVGAARVGHADRHVAILGHVHCHGRAGGLHAAHRHARVRRRRHGQNQRVGAGAADAVVERQRIEGGVQAPCGVGLGVIALRRQTRQQGPRDHVGRHLADRLAGPVLVRVGRRHPQKRVRVRCHRRVARRSGAVDHGPGVAARGPLPLPEGRSGGHAVRVV